MDSAERTLNPPPVHYADGTPSAAHVSLSALTPGQVGRKLRLIGQMLEITDRLVLLCVPGEKQAVAVDLRVALSGRQYVIRDDEPTDRPPGSAERTECGKRKRTPPTAEQRDTLRGAVPGRQPLTLGRFQWIDVTGWLYPLPDEVRRERVVRQWLRGRERTNTVVGLLEAIHVQSGFEPPKHFDLSSVYDELDDEAAIIVQ